MPRKTAHSKKGGSRSVKKPIDVEEAQEEQDSPPVKSSHSKESAEGERSRRSSTAAQTAASVAESRVTRPKTGRQDSSPSDSRRSTVQDELPAARVRSSRRNASRVCYKESDGEEEVSTPKNEDNFDSNDEFDESDSDEKSHPKGKRGTKSQAKSRSPAKSKKGKGKAVGRGRPSKKKVAEKRSAEEQKPIDVSEEESEYSHKKTKSSSHEVDDVEAASNDESETSRSAVKSEPTEMPGRRSARGRQLSKTDSPISKRPSRNKQVKKYTEVDEDFDDEEDVASVEVKSEDEKKSDQEKKGTSRKRKRDSVEEPSKRSKKEPKESETAVDAENPQTSTTEKVERKCSEKKEDSFEDEPMDVDEVASDSESESENKGRKGTVEEGKCSDAAGSKGALDKPLTTNSINSGSPNKEENRQAEPNHMQNSEDSQKANALAECTKADTLSAEKKDNTPGVIKSVEKEIASCMTLERKSDSKRVSKPEHAFLSKGQAPEISVNGEGEKAREAPVQEKSFHLQNNAAPKANGETETISPNLQKPSIYSDREYISNKSLGVDFVRGLKGNSVQFGFASYNLASMPTAKDKVIHGLDKDVSILCLQNVSKALFYDSLESYFDAAGFKSVVNWSCDGEAGLVTLYKTSVFKVKKVDENSLQKIIQKKVESSGLEEDEKSVISECLSRCGHVLFTHLDFGHDNASLTVANVKIPFSAVNLHALQLACLNQELAELSEQNSSRPLLCGELNASDAEVPYQLLRNGRLNEEILEQFKSETSSIQNSAIMKFLRKIAHNPSVKLNSCYALVLGQELTIPGTKTTFPDLLLVSADNIHTVGIVNLPLNCTERLSRGQVPLKADIAVTLPFPPKIPV